MDVAENALVTNKKLPVRQHVPHQHQCQPDLPINMHDILFVPASLMQNPWPHMMESGGFAPVVNATVLSTINFRPHSPQQRSDNLKVFVTFVPSPQKKNFVRKHDIQ